MTDQQPGSSARRILDALSRRRALRRLAAGGIAAGAAALARVPAGAQNTLVSAATEAAARRAINAINQALDSGDMTLLDMSFAPEYVNHTPHRSFVSGQLFSPDRAGLEASLAELRGAVPDAVLIVDDVIASGDTAAVRATFRGTVDPAAITGTAGSTPQVIRVGGAAFARLVGGLVVESWDYNEAAEVLGALTVAVPETPVPEPERGETRDVRDFQAVSLQGVGTLVIEQGETESLVIEAEPRVLRRIETLVEGGTLIIRPARSFSTREPITYRLTAIELNAIELAGAGRVEAEQLNADELRLSASGSGSVAIADLTADTLDVEASGNVQTELAGTVDSQTVTLAGTTRYDAAELASRIASITADGTARATVRVSESLDAQANAAAQIEYIGDPEVNESVSGVGRVTKVG